MNSDLKFVLALGAKLLPLRSRDKVPDGRLVPNGYINASNDEFLVTKWAALSPHANFGATWRGTDKVIVDIDCQKGGSVSAIELLLGVKLPETLTQATGGGGLHLIFGLKEPETFLPRLGALRGIDLNTNYLVVAPSVHPNGNVYRWLDRSVAPALAPYELVEWMRAKTEARSAPQQSEGELYLPAGSGRWKELQRMAGGLRALGLGQTAIEECLFTIFKHHCEPGEEYQQKIIDLAKFVCTRPPRNTKPKPGELVDVVMQDGRRGKIPMEKLSQAIAMGARRVNK